MAVRFVRLPSGLVVNLATVAFYHLTPARKELGQQSRAMGMVTTIAGHMSSVWGDDAEALARFVATGAAERVADSSPAIDVAAIDDVA